MRHRLLREALRKSPTCDAGRRALRLALVGRSGRPSVVEFDGIDEPPARRVALPKLDAGLTSFAILAALRMSECDSILHLEGAEVADIDLGMTANSMGLEVYENRFHG